MLDVFVNLGYGYCYKFQSQSLFKYFKYLKHQLIEIILHTHKIGAVTCQIFRRGTGGSSSVQIDGEDARQFLAGLAHNIGIETIRAATIVCGAVAARTRSRFLQAWVFFWMCLNVDFQLIFGLGQKLVCTPY